MENLELNLENLVQNNIKVVAQRCSVKKVFLKISQSLQENTCAIVFFSLAWSVNRIQQEKYFSSEIMQKIWQGGVLLCIFRAPFTRNTSKRLLLNSKNALIWKDQIITEEFKTLHNKLVVLHINKASGNVAFLGQKNYAPVLINEQGLNNVNNIMSTYKQKFPNICWTFELHKNCKRFVIAATKCLVKPLRKF